MLRRAVPGLLLVAAFAAALLAYAMEQSQSPQERCCKDVGLLQEAIIQAMNESSASRPEAARNTGWRALSATGLRCRWTDQTGDTLKSGGGSARLVCDER